MTQVSGCCRATSLEPIGLYGCSGHDSQGDFCLCLPPGMRDIFLSRHTVVIPVFGSDSLTAAARLKEQQPQAAEGPENTTSSFLGLPPKNAPTMNEFWRSRQTVLWRDTSYTPLWCRNCSVFSLSPGLPWSWPDCHGGRCVPGRRHPHLSSDRRPEPRHQAALVAAEGRDRNRFSGCLPPNGANSGGRSYYLPTNQIHPSANTAASDRLGMVVVHR